MVITQPTVDDFSDTTVMRVIRKIVNYICNDLVDGINNNDIVSGQFSVQGNQLSGTLTKGDGTTINIPAATLPSGGGGSDNPYPTAVSMALSNTILNFSMTMSSGSPITGSVDLAPILGGYATNTELTEIQEQVNGLAPTVSVDEGVSPPTITVRVNGKTSTDTLPSPGMANLPLIENIYTSGSDLFNALMNLKIGDTVSLGITGTTTSGNKSYYNFIGSLSTKISNKLTFLGIGLYTSSYNSPTYAMPIIKLEMNNASFTIGYPDGNIAAVHFTSYSNPIFTLRTL